MAELVRPLEPEVIVGLPTLGLVYAPGVAHRLDLSHYVPLGSSRKYWYEDEPSVPVRSITSPQAGRRLFLDPNLVARLQGRRTVIVDDVISTGQTARAALDLVKRLVVVFK
jgi:adenine/guanine phosphoribosyltransferase-like PRPP-binding protein